MPEQTAKPSIKTAPGRPGVRHPSPPQESGRGVAARVPWGIMDAAARAGLPKPTGKVGIRR